MARSKTPIDRHYLYSKVYYINNANLSRIAINKIMEAVANQPDLEIALDYETTALDPREGKIRTTNIAFNLETAYVFDHFAEGVISVSGLLNVLAHFENPVYVFNIGFEGAWSDEHGGRHIPEFWDIGIMRKMRMGGGPLKLSLMANWDLDVEMDKSEQDSGWAQPELRTSQIMYAGYDALITLELGRKWQREMPEAALEIFRQVNEVWRPVAEMQDTGFYLDVEHHKKLINMWELRRDVAEKTIRKFVTEEDWPNLRSKQQLSKLLHSVLDKEFLAAWPKTAKTQQLQSTRNNLKQFSYASPYPFSRFLAAIMVFNRADKYLGTYGEKLVTVQELSGRIRPRFNIGQAVTMRFSSSGNMNAQNLPRAPLVRRSFIAPSGANLILADYSGIELRVLAEISGDEQLKQDVIFGNVHAESAIAVFDLDREDFMMRLANKEAIAKELRSKAKAFSFQLTYGAGDNALAVVLRCTPMEAGDYVRAWAARYPKAYKFRQLMFEQMRSDGFLPVVTGRTIFVPRLDRTMPVASNYPIQGAAADVMYVAINAVYNRLIDGDYDAVMQGTVHDELLIVNYDIDASEEVLQCLEEGMKDGWLSVFPNSATDNLIESAIGNSWSAKP